MVETGDHKHEMS